MSSNREGGGDQPLNAMSESSEATESDDATVQQREGDRSSVMHRLYEARDSGRLVELIDRATPEERAYFQARLLESVGEAVIATAADGEVLYWNKCAEQMYGWNSEEALGENILTLTPSRTSAEQAAQIMDALKRGEQWSGEFRVQRKDGSEFWAQVTDTPLRDAEGRLIGVVGVSRDLTEVKLIEAKLRRAQKLEAVGKLAGGVAHDFNNLLTAILGNVQFLRSSCDDPEFDECLREIEMAGERAARLTGELLDFRRKQAREAEVIGVAEVLAEHGGEDA